MTLSTGEVVAEMCSDPECLVQLPKDWDGQVIEEPRRLGQLRSEALWFPR